MLIAQRPTLTEESLNPQRSRFTIEPLEPGFGYTLGQFAAPHTAELDSGRGGHFRAYFRCPA